MADLMRAQTQTHTISPALDSAMVSVPLIVLHGRYLQDKTGGSQ